MNHDEYGHLAKEFLALWQKQTRQVTQDANLFAQGMEMLRGFTAGSAAPFTSQEEMGGFALPPHLTPLHMSLQGMYWQNIMSAMAAGSCAKGGVDGRFGMEDSTTLFALMRRMAEDPEFAAAVRAEIQQRLQFQMQSMQAYCHARYERVLEEPEAVWESGNCRLLHYPAKGKKKLPALLLIPSLINRYYILDLTEATSFARFLAARGFPVYLVDWSTPAEAEKSFDSEAYVTRYLCAIGEFIRAQGHKKTLAAGHCMGGMLALALAAIRADLVNALALFATPWDFSADPLHPALQGEQGNALLERYIDGFDFFPGEHILAMFYLRDPWLFQEKLEHFHDLEPGSEAQERFLAIEHWVNGCVPITRGIARDGFLRWGAYNEACNGLWRVGGRLVNPAEIAQPSFVVTPKKDRIVPYLSALPLARALKHTVHLEPDTGHVGMIVGSQAKEQMWEPFVEWAKKAA